MTGPEDSHSSTRPISVAELLAKNGTIGAPPVGGRRRRRRGNSDSVTVAELTGEIPIVGAHDDDEPETTRQSAVVVDEPTDVTGSVTTNGATHHDDIADAEDDEAEQAVTDDYDDVTDDYDDVDDEYADAVADYSAHLGQRDADPDLDLFEPPRRSHYAPRRFQAAGSGAEQMSPDPLDDDIMDSSVDAPEIEDEDVEAALDADDREPLPSYLRSTDGPLFGGQTVADDLARRGTQSSQEDVDLDEETDAAPSPTGSSFVRGALVVLQCMIAVAFGAGLFIAFDQLWKWNSIVALVLGVLVILGLVAGVRVVRKTEDIGSTLIAVAVGAMVTFGPLALLQAG
ncbi:hypothetical protein [Mycobacterium sp.]|uniref:hypothetical protein n=1 Tax=Mycobacterium sp. TaxID=1785 RepID=UPI002D89191E|nr:hypothetical protein [Mycobacterium sp.]